MEREDADRMQGSRQLEKRGYDAEKRQHSKEIVMDELAAVNALYNLSPGGNEVSKVERLLNEFEAHESKEEKSVEQYRNALGDMKNPVSRFVMQLIISDEEKHRAVTHAMASTLKGSLTWSRPAGSLEEGTAVAEENASLLKNTEEFIELERKGIREYKNLLKESEGYYHGLFKILLESMIRDSEKHVELLEFLRQRLKEK